MPGQEFEDHRLPFEDWPEFHKETPSPLGTLPMLEVDGKKLAQSYAVARFLARKFGLAGKTDWEQAQVDSLVDQFKDLDAEIRKFMEIIEKVDALSREEEKAILLSNKFLEKVKILEDGTEIEGPLFDHSHVLRKTKMKILAFDFS